jgi:integrase
MGRTKRPLRDEVESLPKPKKFLDSIGRGSNNSRRAYLTALVHFQECLTNMTIESVLDDKNIDIYEVLEGFISSLHGSPKTIQVYVEAVKSYLEYYDIDINRKKFKKRCRMPKVYREDEEALSAADIRKMLLSCSNRRLKPYILTLASGALRAVEGLAIRNRDINFDTKPVTVHIRKEYSKTKTARTVYISDEAAYYVKQWRDWKYRPARKKQYHRDDLVFTIYQIRDAPGLYPKLNVEFNKLQDVAGFTDRKDGSPNRRKFTLHSFRRFTKSVLSDSIGQDYSEWFLGHTTKSSYYVRDPDFKQQAYLKAMKYLTFLDYTTLEATGKSIEAQLDLKDKEISNLRKELYDTDEGLSKQLSEKDVIMQKAIQGIDLLMKQREEDSKRIQELEGLISKVLPMGQKIHDIKEKVDGVKSTLKEAIKVK